MSSVFPPGVQLATRYRVLRLLETNHVGGLFEAERLDTQRRVALKWLRFTGSGGAQLAQRHAARARAASQVRHPQLALVHDVAHEGSSLFVVSELLRGEPLRARLAPHAMPLHERLRALADAARALAFAHQKGLVHGGLHPGNIFLHREHEAWVGLPPVVKVHDFGSSASTMPECLAYPAERSVLGAHAFFDHAQLCGAEPDAQSDIYALAVLAFQALTGFVPYAAKNPIELAVKLATSPVPTAGDHHVGLPAALDALIFQSLQHERSARPQQLEPLAAQVSRYAEQLAAGALCAAGDNLHTRRMVQERATPGSQVTRLLTVMGDDVPAPSPIASPAEAAHATTQPPLQPEQLCAPTPGADRITSPAQRDAPTRHTELDPAPVPTHEEAATMRDRAASGSPRLTLEMTQRASVVEISRHPTVVGEAVPDTSRDAQRAAYVEVVGRTRVRPRLQLAAEPPSPLLGGFARGPLSKRVRGWSAAAAAIVALAGLSISFATASDPDEPAPSLPPALPNLDGARPAPERGQLVERPAPRDPVLVDTLPEPPEHFDRQAAQSAEPATDSARDASLLARPRARLDAALGRASKARSERLTRMHARPEKLERLDHDDGYLVGAPPTKDQF